MKRNSRRRWTASMKRQQRRTKERFGCLPILFHKKKSYFSVYHSSFHAELFHFISCSLTLLIKKILTAGFGRLLRGQSTRYSASPSSSSSGSWEWLSTIKIHEMLLLWTELFFSVNNNSGQNCIFLSCVLMAWQGWPKNKESDVSSNTLPKCLLDVLMQTNNLWLFSSNICLSFKHWIRRQLFDPRLVHAFKSLSITLVGWRKSPFYHWKVAIRWTHFEGLYLVLEYSHSQARHVKIWHNFT